MRGRNARSLANLRPAKPGEIGNPRGLNRRLAGHLNGNWKGDTASYAGFHFRVERARGKPQHCEQCGKSDPGRYEWANLTGNYADVMDYKRMCKKCHAAYDRAHHEIKPLQAPRPSRIIGGSDSTIISMRGKNLRSLANLRPAKKGEIRNPLGINHQNL